RVIVTKCIKYQFDVFYRVIERDVADDQDKVDKVERSNQLLAETFIVVDLSVLLYLPRSQLPCDNHYKDIALCLCRLERMDVAGVNKIKHSTYENHLERVAPDKRQLAWIGLFNKAHLDKMAHPTIVQFLAQWQPCLEPVICGNRRVQCA